MKKTLQSFILLFFFSLVSHAQLSPTTFSKVLPIIDAGDQPYRMVSGDFNSDGHIDLIVATFFDNTIELYSNDGNGNFSLHSTLTNSLSGITGIKLARINADSHIDIIACSHTNDNVVWFANDAGGGGNFGAEQVLPFTVNGATGLAVGTINNDSTIDIAVSASVDNTVVWFSNDGTGTFTGPNDINGINPLTTPDKITLTNLDPGMDSDLDVIITTGQYNAMNVVEIFRNDGTGAFTKDASSVGSGLKWLTEAIQVDYDGDANLDILVTATSATIGTGSLIWYEDTGAGFTETFIPTTLGNPSMARMADLDADGKDDLIVANGSQNGPGNDLIWFKNIDGAGNFGPLQVIDNTQSQVYVFEIADFDNDTYLDIASSDFNTDQLNWFVNETYVLGLNDEDKDTFSIYPNPSSNKLNFRNTTTDDFDFSVYDILGKKIIETTKNVNSSLDISALEAGIYILKLNDFNKTYKFIKQ